ncbi:MAG: hypothetical protein RIB47_04650 [Cyclobacteriaceae bacterium]
MKDLTAFNTTYTEDLYKIPGKNAIAISCRWSAVSIEERELLSKIMGAVRLDLAAVQVIFVEDLQLSEWVEKPKRLIAFGLAISGVAKYEVITTPETQLVLADSLSDLMNDDGLKKKLWQCLKQLFTI